MPFVNVNQIIIEDEAKEMQEILEKNQEAQKCLEEFESELKETKDKK